MWSYILWELFLPTTWILVGLFFNIEDVIEHASNGNFAQIIIIFVLILIKVSKYIIIYHLNKESKLEEKIKEKELNIKKITSAFNESIKKEKEKNNKLSQLNEQLLLLIKSKTPFKDVSYLYADYETCIYKKDEHYLRYKPHPANSAADKVKEIRRMLNEKIVELKQIQYKYDFILGVFPALKENFDDEEVLIHSKDHFSFLSETDNRDFVRDWVSEEEYRKMPNDERNQLALDRYKNRQKTNWEIGIEYELYIGYLLREGKPPFNKKYKVIQYGEANGINDLGRDIIAERMEFDGTSVKYIIQCKRWSEERVVHENAICQLFGTTIEYRIKDSNCNNRKIIPVFVTTADLSDMAKEFAKTLNVLVYKIKMGDFPMIKCNINNGNKIYHLPFDQQYHRTEITKDGEFYAMTVKEASDRGFRRAIRHFSQ